MDFITDPFETQEAPYLTHYVGNYDLTVPDLPTHAIGINRRDTPVYLSNHKTILAACAGMKLGTHLPRQKIICFAQQRSIVRDLMEFFPDQKHLVFKHPLTCKGEGVFVVENTVEGITPILSAFYRVKPRPFDFVVQEKIKGQTVSFNDRLYDGALRVVFSLIREKDEVRMTFHGGYWKIPPSPIDSTNSVQERTVSKIEKGSVALSEIDRSVTIPRILRTIFPVIAETMFLNDGPILFDKFLQSTDPTVNYAASLVLKSRVFKDNFSEQNFKPRIRQLSEKIRSSSYLNLKRVKRFNIDIRLEERAAQKKPDSALVQTK
jgi:hypothetical protein